MILHIHILKVYWNLLRPGSINPFKPFSNFFHSIRFLFWSKLNIDFLVNALLIEIVRNYTKNWVLATNSDFLITITLQPNVAYLRYFKLWILLHQIIWVWNIKGFQHRVLKILRFKYLILCQRLNSFT